MGRRLSRELRAVIRGLRIPKRLEDERGSREYAEPLFLSELTSGSWRRGTTVVTGGQHLLDGGGACRMEE